MANKAYKDLELLKRYYNSILTLTNDSPQKREALAEIQKDIDKAKDIAKLKNKIILIRNKGKLTPWEIGCIKDIKDQIKMLEGSK